MLQESSIRNTIMVFWLVICCFYADEFREFVLPCWSKNLCWSNNLCHRRSIMAFHNDDIIFEWLFCPKIIVIKSSLYRHYIVLLLQLFTLVRLFVKWDSRQLCPLEGYVLLRILHLCCKAFLFGDLYTLPVKVKNPTCTMKYKNR